MQRSTQEQTVGRSSEKDSSVAKALAPEDVRVGDFVALLQVTCELPSFLWCADATILPPHEPVRIQYLPWQGFDLLKVESICLPFVLTKRPCGSCQTLDVRCCRLARLERRFGKAAWKAYRRCQGKRRKK